MIWVGPHDPVMLKPQTLRTRPDQETAPEATTTLVRADPRPLAETHPDLHPQLRSPLHELQPRTNSLTPDVGMLLRLIKTITRPSTPSAAASSSRCA
jgi:hypothetical protein